MNANRLVVGALVVSGLVAGSVLMIYLASKWKKQKDVDEGFSESGAKSPLPKKVLVLGLDGAGKTTLLTILAKKEVPSSPTPTEGFNVVTVQTDKMESVDTWEIGGAASVRKYWLKFTEDTRVLVFVVDASNRKRFSEAFDEMHRLLGDQRLLDKPFIVLANKQDIPNAASPSEVREALGLEDIKHHRVQVVATSLTSSDQQGVDTVRSLLDRL